MRGAGDRAIEDDKGSSFLASFSERQRKPDAKWGRNAVKRARCHAVAVSTLPRADACSGTAESRGGTATQPPNISARL